MVYKTKFKINKEKGVIVCLIECINDIESILRKYNLTYPEGWMKARYKGIARCSPEDEWDETYGRRLAEYRARRARQIDINNELKNFYKRENIKLSNLINYGLVKTPKHPDEDERNL